jgi:ATP-dependent helicase HepA
MSVAIGQRWVSTTESELGLGTIIDATERTLRVDFAACDEQRTYAIDNNPLGRIRLAVGDRSRMANGSSFTVSDRREVDGLLVYEAIDDSGALIQIPETELDASLQFHQPQQRLFAGHVDSNKAFELRAATHHFHHQHERSPAIGLIGGRIDLLGHQLYIAREVTERANQRVLLADEVGLGKTIEAGLIIHKLIVTERASRVLILVPETLIHQWLIEMLRRVNLEFTILDAERCEAIGLDSEVNPFETTQLALCPLDLLTDPGRQLQCEQAGWDVLVVDEAHRLSQMAPDRVAEREYEGIALLARSTPNVLLLTATPEQLGIEGHFERLQLLDPNRYHDPVAFAAEEAGYETLSRLVGALDDLQRAIEHEELGSVAALARAANVASSPLAQVLLSHEFQRLSQTLTTLAEPSDRYRDLAASRDDIDHFIQSLLDRHGTGRVVFRNTRASVGGFADRALHFHPLEITEPLADLTRQTLDDLVTAPSTVLGERWSSTDARVSWLVHFLASDRNRKVLVICALDDTARSLELYLRLDLGLRSSVFHTGMDLVARDRSAAYFAQVEDGAQVLVCSESGSEGRNFQFCSDLVLFDLPMNPDLLEQRIGRLDRIGQLRTVNVHLPHYPGTGQHVLARWLHEGAGAIEAPLMSARALFDEMRPELERAMRAPQDRAVIDPLLHETRRRRDEMEARLHSGRYRLLELNSYRRTRAAETIALIEAFDDDANFPTYVESLLDFFGVDQQRHSNDAVILAPSEHMLVHGLPGLEEGGMTATMSRRRSLQREDMAFLTIEHPLVHSAMGELLSGGFGSVALGTIEVTGLTPGTVLLESIHLLHCPAPRWIGLQQFLPVVDLRHLLDEHGNDLATAVAATTLSRLVKPIADEQVPELIDTIQPRLVPLIAESTRIAERELIELLEDSTNAIARFIDRSRDRLEALARVNPNIDPRELQELGERSEAMQSYLGNAELKLDALRVIVAT